MTPEERVAAIRENYARRRSSHEDVAFLLDRLDAVQSSRDGLREEFADLLAENARLREALSTAETTYLD